MLVLFAGVLLGAVVAATWFNETPFGAACRAQLIERPARWLAGASLAQVVTRIIVVAVTAAFCVAAPELAMFAAADLALYVELVVAASFVSAQLRWKPAGDTVRRLAKRFAEGARPRSRAGNGRVASSRALKPQRKARPDDDPAATGFAFA